MRHPISIFLRTENQSLYERWEAALSSSQRFVIVSDDGKQRPGDSAPEPDLVVTDHLPVTGMPECWLSKMHHGELGVIAVHCRGAADVQLPLDHSARELRLACQLLAQIVRLRIRVARQRNEHRLLQHLAYSDPLTGLANRRYWDAQLERRIQSDFAADSDSCLALIDIDHFKRVNDRYGHAVGDDLLRAVGRQLAASCRSHDLLARLGGDEFAVLLSGVGCATALATVERIRRSVAEARIETEPDLRITASAGYHVLTTGITNGEEAFAAADNALRKAKVAGRNRSLASDAT